jgi:hypothetical protein
MESWSAPNATVKLNWTAGRNMFAVDTLAATPPWTKEGPPPGTVPPKQVTEAKPFESVSTVWRLQVPPKGEKFTTVLGGTGRPWLSVTSTVKGSTKGRFGAVIWKSPMTLIMPVPWITFTVSGSGTTPAELAVIRSSVMGFVACSGRGGTSPAAPIPDWAAVPSEGAAA